MYTLLTAFIGPWVDFIFAKVICRANSDQYTVAIGLWKMLEKEYIDSWYTSFAAGAVLISIPIALIFLKLQKILCGRHVRRCEGLTPKGVCLYGRKESWLCKQAI